MTRRLRPDTYNKQIGHHFRQITKLTLGEASIRYFRTHDTRDCIEGFEAFDANMCGLTLHGETAEDSHVAIQSLWSRQETTIESARKVAEGLVYFRTKALESGHPNHRWPTLRQLSKIYAQLAEKGGNPIQLNLPRIVGNKVSLTYPRIEMIYVHYATTVMAQHEFDAQDYLLKEIMNDADINKRLRRHVLDRTTIDELATMMLGHDERSHALLKQLLAHVKVEIGPFTLTNHHEHISIESKTWQSDGQWLEYQDGMLSLRDQQLPAIVVDALNGEKLESIIAGIPLLNNAIITKASNPKAYVMQNRPRDDKRNDAPSLRLKLSNKKQTLRKSGVSWPGQTFEHQAVTEANRYQQTLQGPFATVSAEENLSKLVEMARSYRLLSLG